jgi:hypothetical protein
VAKEGRKNSIWVSVLVESGIPVEVKAFRDSRSAEALRRLWLKDIRPDYDEAAVFEVEFPSKTSAEARAGGRRTASPS